MTKQSMIDRTIDLMHRLPVEKAEEISDFANFVVQRFEEQKLTEALQQVTADSKTFDFLHEEEDLYTLADIKEKYHG